MKIGVAGAGPAGLYFALLSAGRGHQVTVFERNAEGATYGWGVVFSANTLAELAAAEPESFADLDEALVRWSHLHVRRPGEHTVVKGQGFSAISRRSLLRVLTEACRRQGVEIRFEDPAGPETLSAFDVAVAADGVHSTLRESHRFRARRLVHATKYIWFGANLRIPGFTFVFQPTEWGLMQVHAYPYDQEMSTFIVEMSEETWAAAGLDTADELVSIALCEEVFAEYLDGARLHSNNSSWISFQTLRLREWHQDNLVLIGDAAHTAHFSIGSGTKLAIEDAVALDKAMIEHPGDLDAAFAAYELERQTAVARFQQAALDSASYFQTVSRYLGYQRERFVFNLMTRSGRVLRSHLVQQDPGFVATVDRALSADDRIVPPSATSIALGSVKLPNRIAARPLDAETLGAGLVIGRSEDMISAVVVDAPRDLDSELVIVDMRGGTRLGRHLSPLTNGGVEPRLDEPLAVLEAVMAAFAGPVGVSISATDWARGGIRPQQVIEVARRLREAGAAFVEVRGGGSVPEQRPDYRRLNLIPLADMIRNEVGVPVIATGRISTFDEVDTVVAAGRADICLMEPWVYKDSLSPDIG